MQELMVYAGHSSPYEKCNDVLKEYIGIEVSPSQVYRVTDTYGEQIGKEMDDAERTLPPVSKNDALYVELDGSFALMRKQGWKEIKLGRFFKASDSIRLDGKQGSISHSQYLAHLGDCNVFSNKMEKLIESYGVTDPRLIFITDGAPWIRNWIEDAFPQATSILDYYHASEHLYKFTDAYFSNKETGTKWAKEQQELLLDNKALEVIENIKKIAGADNEAAKRLIDYYQSNIRRMNYKTFKQMGCGIIGSGAIESAHRTVIQDRMKKAGQRWGQMGAQNMLNLRVIRMNERWDKVIKLVKTNFKAAA